jgi:ankyrin repeat protein
MRTSLDRFGRSSLHYAASDGDAAEVATLIAQGEEVNLCDRGGWTPLHFAAQKSSAAVVRLLLQANAAIDVRDSDGNTPLFRAVFSSQGKGDVIGLLRGAGADPFLQNNHGVSPFSLAHLIGNYDVAQFFSDVRQPVGHGG